MTDKLAAAENQLAREQAERIAELETRLTGAEAANAAVELAEHAELSGHLEIVEQLHDYLAAEVCRDGDPTGKMRDFVNSLCVVIDQFDKQRRSRNWYEAAYTAGKQKLVESALAKVCCKGEPHTCDQEAIAAAEGRADRLVLQLSAITADRDRLLAEVETMRVERDRALDQHIEGFVPSTIFNWVQAERDRYAKVFEAAKAWRDDPMTRCSWLVGKDRALADAIDSALAAGKEQT